MKIWSVRGPLIAGFVGVAVLAGGFGGWSVLAQLSGAVVAPGRIEVDQNRQVVQHPDGGVVAEILVQDGDVVQAGDLLVRLDPEALQSEYSVVEGQLFEVLSRRARFEAERDSADEIIFPDLLTKSANPVAAELMEGQSRLYEARMVSEQQVREQLGKRRDQISSQIEGIVAQQQAIDLQLGLLGQELVSQQSLLDRGLAQAARVLDLQREMADLEGRRGELIAAAAQAEGRITETEIDIIKIESTRREEAISTLRDLQYSEIELASRRSALATQIDRLEIRAPVSGIIYNMQVFAPRSVVRAADPVLYVIPQDRPLIITTQINTRDVDQIRLGQSVSLRFSAFDQRQTPELFGEVTQVSADAFTDSESGQSFYRVQIALGEGEVDKLPVGDTLLPGMPVEAFIATRARTPAEYFLKPFIDYFRKAFREN